MILKVVNVAPVPAIPGDVVGYEGEGVFVLLISSPNRKGPPAHMHDAGETHVTRVTIKNEQKVVFAGHPCTLHLHNGDWSIQEPDYYHSLGKSMYFTILP